MLAVKIIGCGDAFGSGGHRNTCFFVKGTETQFLIDCGATTLPALKSYGVSTQNLDAILITHFHGDHFGGVPFILLDLSMTGQHKPLRLISPSGARIRLEQLLDLLYPGTPVLEKLDIQFLEYDPHKVLISNDIRVEAFPMIHTAAASPHGLRIEFENRVISYSGDTEWTDELTQLSKNADLFICECNFYDTVAGGHLNYLQLKEHIPHFTAKKIMLTHLDNEMIQKAQTLDVGVLTDGMLIEM